MKTFQNLNFFHINPFLLNPLFKPNFPYIYPNSNRTKENIGIKNPLMNSLCINQIPPIKCINTLINFPIFYNNNNIQDNKQNGNDKNFNPFKSINPINLNYNLNFCNNTNNVHNSPNSFSSLINNNYFNLNNKNNNNKSLLFSNAHCISRAFEKKDDNNDLLNQETFSEFNKLNEDLSIGLNDQTINSSSKKNKDLFSTNLKKKRGRVSIEHIFKRQKRVHSSTDYDNIIRKLQVHYFTFIVHFINEILDHFFPNDKKLRFLNAGYDMKKNVKQSYVESLRDKKIADILKYKPSPKYKIHTKENINEEIYNKICESNQFMKNFLEINYLELFNKYYIKNSRNFCFDGNEIAFLKTHFFCDLLNENPLSAKKIEEIAKSQYYEKSNNTFFIVEKK